MAGQRLERREVDVARRAARGAEQRRLERRGREHLEVVAADLRVRVLDADDLALLGDPDLALHGAVRLREHGLVGRPAAATDRTAAAVEQPQAHVVTVEGLHERDLGLEQFPARSQVAAVLVAVAVAEHDLLCTAA